MTAEELAREMLARLDRQDDHEARIAALERRSNIKTAIVSGITSIIVAAVTAVASGCALPPAQVPALTQAELAGMSTARLSIQMHGLEVGSATAWWATSDLLVTAGHACLADEGFEEGLGYVVRDDWGVEHPAEVALDLGGSSWESVTQEGTDPDLCALRVTDGYRGRPLALGSADNLRFGAPLCWAGYPEGQRIWYCGSYGSTHPVTGALNVGIPGWHGASGSAVLDSSGRVVGVLVEGGNAPGTQLWLMNVRAVRDLVDALAVED